MANVTTAPHTNPVTAVRNRIVRVGDANTQIWNTPYSNANEYDKTTSNRPSHRANPDQRSTQPINASEPRIGCRREAGMNRPRSLSFRGSNFVLEGPQWDKEMCLVRTRQLVGIRGRIFADAGEYVERPVRIALRRSEACLQDASRPQTSGSERPNNPSISNV